MSYINFYFYLFLIDYIYFLYDFKRGIRVCVCSAPMLQKRLTSDGDAHLLKVNRVTHFNFGQVEHLTKFILSVIISIYIKVIYFTVSK